MAILLLHPSSNLPPYDKWLAELDEELYLFTSCGHSIDYSKSNYRIIKEYRDFIHNPLVEQDAIELSLKEPITKVVTFFEDIIVIAARIRAKLGIGGQNIISAEAYRNKIIMKNFINNNNIKCPSFQEIKTPFDLENFIKTYNFPIVIKPIDGQGSKDTYFIRNRKELGIFYEDGLVGDFMVESYIDGDMYSSNGIAINGQIVFNYTTIYQYVSQSSISQSSSPNKKYSDDCIHYTSLMLPDDPMSIRIKNFTQGVIAALPSPDVLVFHCELFHTKNNELVFCEIASRPPGGGMSDMIKEAYGLTLGELATKLMCGVKIKIPNNQPDMLSAILLIPKKNGKLISTISTFPFDWVTSYTCKIQAGTNCRIASSHLVTQLSDVIGSLIFIAPNYEQLSIRRKIIIDYINTQVVWDC